jgi:hypothetical protein
MRAVGVPSSTIPSQEPEYFKDSQVNYVAPCMHGFFALSAKSACEIYTAQSTATVTGGCPSSSSSMRVVCELVERAIKYSISDMQIHSLVDDGTDKTRVAR